MTAFDLTSFNVKADVNANAEMLGVLCYWVERDDWHRRNTGIRILPKEQQSGPQQDA